MEYNILGENLQLVNIELDEVETVYAETGKFVYKSANVDIDTKVKGGFKSGVKRMLTNESFFVAEFSPSAGKGIVGFGPDVPGKVKAIPLAAGESFIAERDAFICAEESITLDMKRVKVSAGIFGGEGIFLQKLTGPGIGFIGVSGDIIEYNLAENQTIEVFRGHLAGFEPSVHYDIEYVGNVKTAIFGGAGLVLMKLTGPGKIILQSMTRDKLRKELGGHTKGGSRNNAQGAEVGAKILGGLLKK